MKAVSKQVYILFRNLAVRIIILGDLGTEI